MDEPSTCGAPGCDRRTDTLGLCTTHYQADYKRRRRANNGEPLTGTSTDPVPFGDELAMACPASLLPLAAAVADIDAITIVRAIWPHFLEAHLAGVHPFTLEPKQGAA